MTFRSLHLSIGLFLLLGILSMLFLPIESRALPLPDFVKDFCKSRNIDICSEPDAPQESESKSKTPKPRTLTESEQQVLTELLRKRRELEAREAELNRRGTQLRRLEEELQQRTDEVNRLQDRVSNSVEQKRAQDRENLDKTVRYYSQMDAAQAAASLSQLQTRDAVQILLKMKDKDVGAILANMPPQQSARLIEEIIRK